MVNGLCEAHEGDGEQRPSLSYEDEYSGYYGEHYEATVVLGGEWWSWRVSGEALVVVVVDGLSQNGRWIKAACANIRRA